MRTKIKKGDNVEIIGGSDKGLRGEVIKVMPQKDRIVVQGVNIRAGNVAHPALGQ